MKAIQLKEYIMIITVTLSVLRQLVITITMSLLNLLHAVIEDTILMALIGGHISGILFARIIFSLIVSYLIFMIYKRYFKVV